MCLPFYSECHSQQISTCAFAVKLLQDQNSGSAYYHSLIQFIIKPHQVLHIMAPNPFHYLTITGSKSISLYSHTKAFNSGPLYIAIPHTQFLSVIYGHTSVPKIGLLNTTILKSGPLYYSIILKHIFISYFDFQFHILISV